jgi:hypothetical protein
MPESAGMEEEFFYSFFDETEKNIQVRCASGNQCGIMTMRLSKTTSIIVGHAISSISW